MMFCVILIRTLIVGACVAVVFCQSQTQTPTKSLTRSRTQTPSVSRSPSSTGFGKQPVVDNTFNSQNDIDMVNYMNMSALLMWGVTLYWPEVGEHLRH